MSDYETRKQDAHDSAILDRLGLSQCECGKLVEDENYRMNKGYCRECFEQLEIEKRIEQKEPGDR